MQNYGDVVDVMLLYLTHIWTFISYAEDFVEKQFNRRSQFLFLFLFFCYFGLNNENTGRSHDPTYLVQ